ncbi:response regulator [Nitrospira sp. BLG_2]|uniref:response regulator n=1 Tax=Nitrospira sp. BLG_2 TaxID=3397507 RepID=UPI003B9CC29E
MATIFVTDDEQVICTAIVKRLTRQGHFAVGYESGNALLEALQRNLPDLVLLDLKMPGINGLEALKQVRRLTPSTLVIVLTAYGTEQDSMEAMKLGAYDFLIKTVDFEELDTVTARAVEMLKLRRVKVDQGTNRIKDCSTSNRSGGKNQLLCADTICQR